MENILHLSAHLIFTSRPENYHEAKVCGSIHNYFRIRRFAPSTFPVGCQSFSSSWLGSFPPSRREMKNTFCLGKTIWDAMRGGAVAAAETASRNVCWLHSEKKEVGNTAHQGASSAVFICGAGAGCHHLSLPRYAHVFWPSLAMFIPVRVCAKGKMARAHFMYVNSPAAAAAAVGALCAAK
jgi:hypothetical protein